jgi:hypothetical protein
LSSLVAVEVDESSELSSLVAAERMVRCLLAAPAISDRNDMVVVQHGGVICFNPARARAWLPGG